MCCVRLSKCRAWPGATAALGFQSAALVRISRLKSYPPPPTVVDRAASCSAAPRLMCRARFSNCRALLKCRVRFSNCRACARVLSSHSSHMSYPSHRLWPTEPLLVLPRSTLPTLSTLKTLNDPIDRRAPKTATRRPASCHRPWSCPVKVPRRGERFSRPKRSVLAASSKIQLGARIAEAIA